MMMLKVVSFSVALGVVSGFAVPTSGPAVLSQGPPLALRMTVAIKEDDARIVAPPEDVAVAMEAPQSGDIVPLIMSTEATSGEVIVDVPATKIPVSFDTWKQRMVRRLNTHEDFMKIHKVSAAFWILSVFAITCAGLIHGFSEIPDYLEIPSWVALTSSVFQAASAYHMALNYLSLIHI